MPFVDYENESFPSHLPNGKYRLDVTWNDILWAAVTVGRPNLFHVFKHGGASIYEAVFRWSMIYMSLAQRGTRVPKFIRTEAFKRMDPTEKGAVNYFLGLVVGKLFATKLLDAPWTLHLDVWKHVLNPKLLGGRSRPDMVAQSALSNEWHALECKGRASVPGNSEKQKAKFQAQRLVSVGGTNCTLHLGAITYYQNDLLEFYWRDPEPPNPHEVIGLPDPRDAWASYYLPFVETFRSRAGPLAGSSDAQAAVPIEELDLTIMMHSAISAFLLNGNWQRARAVARERRSQFHADGFQADGLMVKAGSSWVERRAE